MKKADVLRLRKQQSRLLCACSGVPVWQAGPGNMDCCYFLDCRFRGNDTLQPAAIRSQPASPARAAACCFIRLKCYRHFGAGWSGHNHMIRHMLQNSSKKLELFREHAASP